MLRISSRNSRSRRNLREKKGNAKTQLHKERCGGWRWLAFWLHLDVRLLSVANPSMGIGYLTCSEDLQPSLWMGIPVLRPCIDGQSSLWISALPKRATVPQFRWRSFYVLVIEPRSQINFILPVADGLRVFFRPSRNNQITKVLASLHMFGGEDQCIVFSRAVSRSAFNLYKDGR